MDALMSFALAFLQASVTSVVAAGVLLAVLAGVRRRWPGVASQRLVWLLAMAAAAGSFMLALWPAPATLRVLPSIEVSRPAVVDETADVAFAGADEGGLALEHTPAPRWLLGAAAVWLLCYGGGLALAVVRLRRGQVALKGLVTSALPLDARALALHPAFGNGAGKTPAVLESAAPISPMLAGLVQPVLLLPRHLRTFDPHQQRLIVAHELAHWQRRDHLWLHASLLLQTVFWFNPALKALAGGLSHAQELGCDRHVLAHRPVAARRDYAAALVAQLKVQQGANLGLAAPFGGSGAAALGERIRQLRLADLGGSTRLAGAGKAALGACCAAVVG
ncbi:M56 family metallopeptidase, partial [Pseudoduganella ginsengisoli]